LKRLLAVLLLFAWLGTAIGATADAHNLNNGYTYIRLHGSTAEVRLLLPHLVLLTYDLNRNEAISDDELKAQSDAISAYMENHFHLYNNLLPMTYTLVDMKTIIQQQTEDPMVEFNFRFDSDNVIENLNIVYDVILADVDPDHQNYIQIYDDKGDVVMQRVVDKYSHKFTYVKGGGMKFPAHLLGTFVALGGQHAARSVLFLLFAVCLSFHAVRFRTLLETALVFAVANMLGCIVSFRYGYNLPILWANWFVIALIFYCAVDLFRKKTLHWRKGWAAAFGGAHGLATFSYVMGLGAPAEYKMIFLLAFDAGIFLAFAGLVGALYALVTLIRRSPLYRAAEISAAVLVGLSNVILLFSM